MKGLNILFAMLFFTSSLFAATKTGTISGSIKDKSNQNPIEGVSVKIQNEADKKELIVLTDKSGNFEFKDVPVGSYYLTATFIGYAKYRKSNVAVLDQKIKKININLVVNVAPPEIVMHDEEVVMTDNVAPVMHMESKSNRSYAPTGFAGNGFTGKRESVYHNTESYAGMDENRFKEVALSPLSTFAADVDAASYSNIRRFLSTGVKPDKGAVRVEEMINYFTYDYPQPKGDDPFSITTEIGDCPWSDNKLVHIGLQGKRIETDNLPPSNLVFLLDVSGSMGTPNKLPLLKKSFKMLVNELGEKDRIAIVVYAGAAGTVLESTTADNKETILDALDKLNAGGSTAGGQGIELAYKVAQEHFIKGGNNRVILATDGDFNIGMSSDAAMKDLIEKKRATGVFLTCLGFGTGNIKDSKMEMLANKGNGNYAYIDNVFEAKKVLVTEMGATLLTIAKDVKIQVEFNPSIVSSYRLVGYENRLLNAEDFNDDTKDAGEIGAGHSVTALYEVVLVGDEEPSKDQLRYQEANKDKAKTYGNEILTVKFRYKQPDGDVSKLIERNLENKITSKAALSNNFNFSAAVAGLGMLLRESEFSKDLTYDDVYQLAVKSKGDDKNGYRAEFIRMVEAAELIYN